jgi:hypothetical protein
LAYLSDYAAGKVFMTMCGQGMMRVGRQANTSQDPQRLLNVIIRPDMVEILVAGDPGRNQARAYMSNHLQGPPTSRRVVLPRRWKQLLARDR